MKKYTIVWNGCDQHITLDEAEAEGRIFDGKLWNETEGFKPFDVVEISENDLPIEDGEIDYSGTYVFNDGLKRVIAVEVI